MSTVVTAWGGCRPGLLLAACVLAAVVVGAGGPTSAIASEGPPERPDTRQVMFVGNNWDGTADIVDARTFERLARINVIPDKQERLREIRTDPERLAFFLAIRQFVGEGNDQYTDDMFTTHDGRLVAVSRPSFADVVGISLRTQKIVWRFPMEGQRSDHMAISPDGRRLLVSDSTANVVHELNIRTGEKTGEFPSGDSPHENNYSEDGSLIYHASIGRVYTPTDRCAPALPPSAGCLPRDTSKGDRRFQIVDADSLEILERWDIGEELDEFAEETGEDRYAEMSSAVRPMALSRNERYAYLQVSFHHGFVEFDLHRGRVLRVADLPIRGDGHAPPETYLLDSAHHGLAMNERGTKLCVAGTMSDYAAIVSRRTFDHEIVSRGSKPYWSTTGPIGNRCWVSYSGDDEVVVLDYGSQREVARIPVGDHPQRVRAGAVRHSFLAALPEPPGAGDDDDGGGPGRGGSSGGHGGGTGDDPPAGDRDASDGRDGAQRASTLGASARTTTVDRLPFTGLGLGLLALAGALLAVGGLALRRHARARAVATRGK